MTGPVLPASGNARVCAAVSLGWQVAKLYHSPVHAGAAADPRRGPRLPGISGLELQARLNAEKCRIPIIFITAHGDAEMRALAMGDGAVEFLTKPFNDAVLLEIVNAALDRRRNA